MTMRNPASSEVHAWCVRLDVPRDVSEGLAATLSEEERNRSARFRFDRDRRRFGVAHGVLRDLLGRYVGTRPGDIRFVHNPFGKPGLDPGFGSRLKFNLSHSAGLALIAIAADAEVGVDIERLRTRSDHAEIARNFFSAAEIDDLNLAPSRLYGERFLMCWTQKEAYMKARGEGFGIPPASFSVDRLDGAWSLFSLRPAPGYFGALAVEGAGRRLSLRPWKSSDALVDAVHGVAASQ